MSPLPILETARLKLRPYLDTDVAELMPLISTREVAATTGRIPHPYSEKDAKQFIADAQNDDEVRLAITLHGDGRMVGGIGLRHFPAHQNSELGYWLGVPYWGKGYATEASREMLRYGFESLGLNRIFATVFAHNPASSRVLIKLGMKPEGYQRQHIRKWDQFVDLELYGMLHNEWRSGE
jgi:[ribosomal protein S5]-alanine N-acetyltransferase